MAIFIDSNETTDLSDKRQYIFKHLLKQASAKTSTVKIVHEVLG
jgi:hypothetical protein